MRWALCEKCIFKKHKGSSCLPYNTKKKESVSGITGEPDCRAYMVGEREKRLEPMSGISWKNVEIVRGAQSILLLALLGL